MLLQNGEGFDDGVDNNTEADIGMDAGVDTGVDAGAAKGDCLDDITVGLGVDESGSVGFVGRAGVGTARVTVISVGGAGAVTLTGVGGRDTEGGLSVASSKSDDLKMKDDCLGIFPGRYV